MSTTRRLIVHPGALGDVLQAVPALRALRRDGTLTFAGQLRIARLLHGLGVIDEPLSFDSVGLEALFTDDPVPSPLSSRLGAVDSVVSWFGARDETYVRRLRSIVPDAVIAPPVPPEGSNLTVWQHLLATVGSRSSPDLSPLDPLRSWRDEASRTLAGLTTDPARPLLVVHPGAGGVWKIWPVERLAGMIARLVARQHDALVLIHQGPADRDVAGQLGARLDVETRWLIEPELPLLAAVLAGAAAYLGGDSGVSHLAAAVGAPAVIVFPSSTRERWAPWSPTALAFTMSDDSGDRRVEDAVIGRLRDRRR